MEDQGQGFAPHRYGTSSHRIMAKTGFIALSIKVKILIVRFIADGTHLTTISKEKLID